FRYLCSRRIPALSLRGGFPFFVGAGGAVGAPGGLEGGRDRGVHGAARDRRARHRLGLDPPFPRGGGSVELARPRRWTASASSAVDRAGLGRPGPGVAGTRGPCGRARGGPVGVAGTLAGGSGARWSCPCDHVAACLWSASVGPDHTPAQLGAVRRDRWCPVGGG